MKFIGKLSLGRLFLTLLKPMACRFMQRLCRSHNAFKYNYLSFPALRVNGKCNHIERLVNRRRRRIAWLRHHGNGVVDDFEATRGGSANLTTFPRMATRPRSWTTSVEDLCRLSAYPQDHGVTYLIAMRILSNANQTAWKARMKQELYEILEERTQLRVGSFPLAIGMSLGLHLVVMTLFMGLGSPAAHLSSNQNPDPRGNLEGEQASVPEAPVPDKPRPLTASPDPGGFHALVKSTHRLQPAQGVGKRRRLN